MSAIDICNAALIKCHHTERLAAGTDLTNPVGKAQLVCATYYDQARKSSLRLAAWTCVKKRLALASAEWAATTDYAVDDKIVTALAVFRCTTAGTSGAAAPTWPDADDVPNTVTDGTVVWTYDYTNLEAIPADNYTGLSYACAMPSDYINQIEGQDQSGQKIHFEIEGGVFYANIDTPVLVYVPDETDDTKWDPLLREVITTQLASMISYPLTGSHENEMAYAQAAMGMAMAANKKTKREARQGAAPGIVWMDGVFEETL